MQRPDTQPPSTRRPKIQTPSTAQFLAAAEREHGDLTFPGQDTIQLAAEANLPDPKTPERKPPLSARICDFPRGHLHQQSRSTS